MSQTRQPRRLTAGQEPFLTARSLATTYSRGHIVDEHAHPWHQLLYACTGAMTVFAERFSWMIPPGRAVLIPAGCRHSIRMWGDVAMRSVYLPATLAAAALRSSQCRVISVTALLRELILRVVESSALDSREPRDGRLLALLLDEIEAAPETPLMLPLPADFRALSVARHVIADPSGEEALDDLARRFGVGARTLERLFRGETGMSFGLWRQKGRLLESVRLLAEGKPVTEAALGCGYNSVSAFIAAFRRTFGCTPGKMWTRAWQDAAGIVERPNL